MGHKAPILVSDMDKDELNALVDDIAELLERYEPNSDPEPYEEQIFTWEAMYDELAEMLHARGVPLDLERFKK